MTPRILIGLTGNIATGKSEVTKTLRELGAVIIDADVVAREVVEPGAPALAKIARAFGDAVLQPDGSLNRSALGAIVFKDAARLRELEAMTHPAVRERILQALAGLLPDTVAVLEAIRLIEGGYADKCQSVWVTHCPEQDQIARLIKSRGMSEQAAWARVRAQNPQSEKLARADVIIDTSGEKQHTHAQVVKAWANLMSRHEPPPAPPQDAVSSKKNHGR
jgi:dephospho-CoA kinase